MENANKYLLSGYVVILLFIGILFYLSKVNSDYLITTLVLFLLVVSGLFFYGLNLFKNTNNNIILPINIEKREEFEKEFLSELNEALFDPNSSIKLLVYFLLPDPLLIWTRHQNHPTLVKVYPTKLYQVFSF